VLRGYLGIDINGAEPPRTEKNVIRNRHASPKERFGETRKA